MERRVVYALHVALLYLQRVQEKSAFFYVLIHLRILRERAVQLPLSVRCLRHPAAAGT